MQTQTTIKPDYSTINMRRLRMYPIYKKPATYHIDNHMGAGCAGDAPGFPSYFLQSVYTQYGNSPAKGPTYVIRDDAGNYRRIPEFDWSNDEGPRGRNAILRKLWSPLPVDNPRVREWMARTFQHMKHCYRNPEATNPQNRDSMVIWPVPRYTLPLRPERTIKRGTLIYELSAEQYRVVLSGYRAEVKAIYQKVWSVVKDRNNYAALISIRKFYPSFELPAPITWIEKTPALFQADWWERYDHQPTEIECPGFHDDTHATSMNKYHNCRMCGRVAA